MWTSHEALILGYEEALTRQDSTTGGWYDCSAHMLWIGERTRELDGAHVEFLRGVGNPIGCKVGPSMTRRGRARDVRGAQSGAHPGPADADHPDGRRPHRAGAAAVAARRCAMPATRSCGRATRCTATRTPARAAARRAASTPSSARSRASCRAHRSEGTWPGGIHIELTGDDVTECVGGGDEISDTDLDNRYETMCDPRLNARQSLDLAFRTAESDPLRPGLSRGVVEALHLVTRVARGARHRRRRHGRPAVDTIGDTERIVPPRVAHQADGGVGGDGRRRGRNRRPRRAAAIRDGPAG